MYDQGNRSTFGQVGHWFAQVLSTPVHSQHASTAAIALVSLIPPLSRSSSMRNTQPDQSQSATPEERACCWRRRAIRPLLYRQPKTKRRWPPKGAHTVLRELSRDRRRGSACCILRCEGEARTFISRQPRKKNPCPKAEVHRELTRGPRCCLQLLLVIEIGGW